MSPDLTSLTASSADFQTLDVLGMGWSWTTERYRFAVSVVTVRRTRRRGPVAALAKSIFASQTRKRRDDDVDKKGA